MRKIMGVKNRRKLKEKGITLIALVITIIILLILAGITLYGALGQNGLFSRAKLAAQKYKESEADETEKLGDVEKEIDKIINGESTELVTKIKGIDEKNQPISNWKFSIFNDKSCMDSLAENIEVKSESGEYDCSSTINKIGKYYIGITSAPEGYNLPSQIFEFNVTNEANQELIISFSIEDKSSKIFEISGDEVEEETIDFEYECCLTFDSGDYVTINPFENKNSFIEVDSADGLALELQGECVVDLFKIAEWDNNENKYVFTDDFIELNNFDTSSLKNMCTYDPILTSKIISLINSKNIKPCIAGCEFGKRVNKLDNGKSILKKDCYLILPRGKDSQEIGKASLNFFDVSFIPLIISFPKMGHLYDIDLCISCVNGKNKISNIEIINNIEYDPEQEIEPQIFVYQIKGNYNGEDLYDNIISVLAKNSDIISSSIPLPVGLNYTVTNIYKGSRCEYASDESVEITLEDEEVSLEFSYYYNEGTKNSSVLTETFEFDVFSQKGMFKSPDRNGITSKVDILDIKENLEEGKNKFSKTIRIKNNTSEEKFIRFKIFAPDAFDVDLDSYSSYTLCSTDGVYYYYFQKVPANSSTEDITFNLLLDENKMLDDYSCNIAIMAESTEVINAGSEEEYANWDN